VARSGAPATGEVGAPDPTVRYAADVVVTMDADATVHRPGAVEVVGDRIVWVGPLERGGARARGPTDDEPGAGATEDEREPRHRRPDRVVTLGGLLMPGLVNTHGHSAMTLLRGAGDGLPLDRWLHEAIWPREARLTGEDAWWGMLLGAAELLRAGVTTTCEQYLHAAAVADAALASGVRCVVTPGILDLPGAGSEGSWQQMLEDAGHLHAAMDGRDERLSIGVGPHAAYTLPEEGLVATAQLAAELGALVHIHVAETRSEGLPILERYGCSVPELLDRLGILDCRVLAAHSVWLSDADIALYERHDVAVAHCPQSNGKLGSGIARVSDMLARGIRVGLGTDGPASNDNLDLWEELRLAPLLARATVADPGALGTVDALALATTGGADALGLACGRLAPGRLADMVRLDIDDAAFVPGLSDADVLAHLVWAASSRLVTDVWVGGRHVVAGGACRTLDESEARRQVAARARRLAGR
jgi:5-methylthioadenosine/S-adenosylhomocysteine deaminase